MGPFKKDASLKVDVSTAKRKNPSCTRAQTKRAPTLYVHTLVIGVLLTTNSSTAVPWPFQHMSVQ